MSILSMQAFHQKARWGLVASALVIHSATLMSWRAVAYLDTAQGFGDKRQIHIKFVTKEQHQPQTSRPGDYSSHMQTASARAQTTASLEQAKDIFRWCQEGDPELWRYSHSEIQQVLQSGKALPVDIQQLIASRSARPLPQHPAA